MVSTPYAVRLKEMRIATNLTFLRIQWASGIADQADEVPRPDRTTKVGEDAQRVSRNCLFSLTQVDEVLRGNENSRTLPAHPGTLVGRILGGEQRRQLIPNNHAPHRPGRSACRPPLPVTARQWNARGDTGLGRR